MSTKKPRLKVVGVTATRAEYDLLSSIYRALSVDRHFEFKLLVTGAHLSPTFGRSVEQVYSDRLPVLSEIECLLDSNTPSSRIKTAAIGMIGAIDVLAQYRPDVVLVAGDRENELVVASVCAYLKIPTVHFFGGDHAQDGNVDNPVRHAISKLVTFHFVAHPNHELRLKSVGESPNRIFFIGSPALDKFRTEPRMSRGECFNGFSGITSSEIDSIAVMIYHPILNERANAAGEAATIMQVLAESGIHTFVSSPNSDSGSRDILRVFDEFRRSSNFTFYRNLPRSTFVNLLRHSSFLIGNSSLGLLEAPSIPLPVINVGKRQYGREHADNVVFVPAKKPDIAAAIRTVTSRQFRRRLQKVKNPYGDGKATKRAVQLIRTLDFERWVLKTEDPLEMRSLR